jgi:cell cycle checkpoint control protein RAD9A
MSKYSEELYINAMPNSVAFSATNTSLSAYCRFTYDRNFFTKFNVGDRDLRDGIPDLNDTEQSQTVTGQLRVQVLPLRRRMYFLTQPDPSQPLLAILKHKGLEKTLERLDLIVVDGVFNHEDEDFDSLEGKLIVRLHCKHGEVTISAFAFSLKRTITAVRYRKDASVATTNAVIPIASPCTRGFE